MKCILCKSNEVKSFYGKDNITLWQCEECKLVPKDPSSFPQASEEKERYLEHNNSNDNNGYVDFLNKAISPTIPLLAFDAKGLDYGCGPTPVLASIVEEKGFACDLYDPYFYPELPSERKEFIFATECFEHFFNPAKELQLITALLIPNGLLTVMTQRWDKNTDFSTWWYAQDKTHVLFFHNETFEYISKRYGYTIIHDNLDNVIIMQKKVALQD